MKKARVRELRPIKERPSDYEAIERRIIKAFRRFIYAPLLRELKAPVKIRNSIFGNSLQALIEALQAGRVVYRQGKFTGKFSAKLSKALRDAGARWDAASGGYQLSELPPELFQAVKSSEAAYNETMKRVDKRLSKVLPENIADSVDVSSLLDKLLFKTDQEIGTTLKGISVKADLTPERRKRIADEWENNLRLEIKNFTTDEVLKLRAKVQANVFAGKRFEDMISDIEKSYGVSEKKAKFLARQETNLLVAKFKQARYESQGVFEYRWVCVAGSPLHPVRPSHKALQNQIFRFDTPPITTAPNEPVRRNNPGEDYNCRCNAIPIVRF